MPDKYSPKEQRIVTFLTGKPKGFRFTPAEISKPLDMDAAYIGNVVKRLTLVKPMERQSEWHPVEYVRI